MRCFVLLSSILSFAALGEVAITSSTEVQFATAAQGKDALKTEDDFLKNVSLFDIQVRLQTGEKKEAKDLGEFQASAVREWNDDEKKTLTKILEDLKEKLKPLTLSLPKTILLVKTTGEEEGNAAYTRGNAIFIPPTRLGPGLLKTLAHEIFHVMSRHDRKLRDKAYAFVGFKACNEITLPGEYASRRITNPDAPVIDSYIEIEEKGNKLAMTPVLFASKEKFDPIAKGDLFSYLTFKLMAIENDGKVWRPIVKSDGPIFIDAAKNASFMNQTGDNTKYIIHPEEIMADNFSYLVLGKKDLKTPQIVENLKELLDYKAE